MSLIPIQTESKESNVILRNTSKEVKDIKNPEIQKLIRDMHETLSATANGIGLAAPQVGVNLRIFVASPLLGLNQTVFINPVITKITDSTERMEEGCLSLPGLYGKVKRATSLKVEAYNQNGRKFRMKAEGLIAQLVQHEIGHLDGELFKDKAEKSRKIIFMGTPESAVIVLEKLIASKIYAPCLVITQPDKPAGKQRVLTASPVKIYAEKHGIEISQPEKLKDTAVIADIMARKPDCIIVAAYGKLIPKEILDIPRYGILNIHPSILPRHRGPSPVQYTILEGDTIAGVSIMRIDEGMDSGPVLAHKSIPIAHNETTPVLLQKLFRLGAELLLDALTKWLEGTMKAVPQDNQAATLTTLLTKEDGEIQSDYSAQDIERMVRALSPWPGAYIKIKNQSAKSKVKEEKQLKIIKARIAPCEKILPPLNFSLTAEKELCLHTADGCLILETVHPAGKKPMSGYAFFLGNNSCINLP